MGEYKCVRCTGHGDFKDKADAILHLDHALGISKGRPCRGGDTAPIIEVVATAAAPKPAPARAEKPKEQPKEKPKASEQK